MRKIKYFTLPASGYIVMIQNYSFLNLNIKVGQILKFIDYYYFIESFDSTGINYVALGDFAPDIDWTRAVEISESKLPPELLEEVLSIKLEIL